jgi:hypothetical protein
MKQDDNQEIGLLKDQIGALQEQLEDNQAMSAVERELDDPSTSDSGLQNLQVPNEMLQTPDKQLLVYLEKFTQLRADMSLKLHKNIEKMALLEFCVGRCSAEKEAASNKAQLLQEKLCTAMLELAECQQASKCLGFWCWQLISICAAVITA